MKIQNIATRTVHLASRAVIPTIQVPTPPTLRGPGMIRRFPEVMALTGVDNVLIITGRHLLDQGILDDFLDALLTQHISFSLFTDRKPNPTIQNVADALAQYYHDGCNGVVGFGGGSAMDCAKITAAKVTNDMPVETMRGLLKLHYRLPPFFAVPTTAGSGSEASIAAALTDEETNEKYVIMDTKLVPLATVLDADLTLGLSPKLTVESGMDALTHAIEAYLGWFDTPLVQQKALDASAAIFDLLPAVYDNGRDVRKRQAMLEASFDAAMAFTRGSVGYVHAIAHAIGGKYDLPHGRLCAVILPYILEFSKDKVSSKMAELAYNAGLGDASQNDAALADALIAGVRELNAHFGIPETIAELDIQDVPELASAALAEANPFYPVPRIMDYNQCVEIFGHLLAED